MKNIKTNRDFRDWMGTRGKSGIEVDKDCKALISYNFCEFSRKKFHLLNLLFEPICRLMQKR
jgi:hypothetical protein